VVIGVVQTRYQQYLLRQFPEVFAARIRDRVTRRRGKLRKDAQSPDFEHQGRALIPLAYLVGSAMLLGSGLAAYGYGQVSVVPALLLPWAGFYWARLFFWRRIIK
jgi:fatty acid desaturase